MAITGLIYIIAAIWAYDLIFYKDPNKVYFYAGGINAGTYRVVKKFLYGVVFGFLWIPIAIFLKVVGRR
jgi:hypothetical protein